MKKYQKLLNSGQATLDRLEVAHSDFLDEFDAPIGDVKGDVDDISSTVGDISNTLRLHFQHQQDFNERVTNYKRLKALFVSYQEIEDSLNAFRLHITRLMNALPLCDEADIPTELSQLGAEALKTFRDELETEIDHADQKHLQHVAKTWQPGEENAWALKIQACIDNYTKSLQLKARYEQGLRNFDNKLAQNLEKAAFVDKLAQLSNDDSIDDAKFAEVSAILSSLHSRLPQQDQTWIIEQKKKSQVLKIKLCITACRQSTMACSAFVHMNNTTSYDDFLQTIKSQATHLQTMSSNFEQCKAFKSLIGQDDELQQALPDLTQDFIDNLGRTLAQAQTTWVINIVC